MQNIDHYELLQISSKADQDTIHRVYRFLAARYHPDNPRSGDAEVFGRLKEAYDVLSDPARRAEYDANYQPAESERIPLSASIDFMDNREGELNRRLALLAVLYHRRRTTPNKPEMSLAEVEKLMGFPRDFLDFTTWYLHRKGYISRADNSDFALTAEGVDFVETQHVNFPTLNKLLTSGNPSSAPEPAPQGCSHAQSPMIVLPDLTVRPDRRVNGGDRRVNTRDRRVNNTDRRQNGGDRRANPAAGCSDLRANLPEH